MYKDISGYLSNVQDAGNYAIQVGTGGYTAEVQKSIFTSVANLIGEITTQYVMRYHPIETDCTGQQCDPKKQYRHIKVKSACQRKPSLSRRLLPVPRSAVVSPGFR